MDTFSLIAEVKRRPALWDSTHPDHSNRSETHKLWCDVGAALSANVELCRTKWKNLRCSYRRLKIRVQRTATPPHWPYAPAMSFLDNQGSSSNKKEMDPVEDETASNFSFIKLEQQVPIDEMEADNDALMNEFQNAATPQALRRVSHSISLASAAAEEQLSDPQPIRPQLSPSTAMSMAASSSCQCAKRVDEQVHFLEGLEREEQQLMQSTSLDITRCKNLLHVGDSDYNFLISFLPLMKQMSPLQNVAFRAKMGELLLHTMAAGANIAIATPQQQQQEQQLKQEQAQIMSSPKQQQEQQTALDPQAQQVSTSSNNWN